MELGLKGKIAVVGGASKGMGRAIAKGLAAEGEAVALLARDAGAVEAAARSIAEETGAETLALPTDVTRRIDVELAVRAVVERWRRLDVLVTNAGGPPFGGFEAMGDEQWQEAFELSLLSVVRLIRAALPHMRAAGGGRIVNLQSTSVKQPIEGLLLSNSIRPGVQGLTKSLSDELGREGITVNCVLPGRIATERFVDLLEHRARAAGKTPEEVRRSIEQSIALGRLGTPEEVAAVVVFLCSDAARYVTGQAITVDGGVTRNLF